MIRNLWEFAATVLDSIIAHITQPVDRIDWSWPDDRAETQLW